MKYLTRGAQMSAVIQSMIWFYFLTSGKRPFIITRFMRVLLLILFLATHLFLNAQLPHSHDSLYQVLATTTTDTSRLSVSEELAFDYFSKNSDSAHYYLDKSLALTRKLNFRMDEAGLLSSKAYLYSRTDFPRAFDLLQQSLKIAEDPEVEKIPWHIEAATPHEERLRVLSSIYFSLAQLHGSTGNTASQLNYLSIKCFSVFKSW
jgi:hypothetical protein